jgi:photosystem II stability/assembly factor-like uncharacterized protein
VRQRTFVAVTVVAVALGAASTATAGINRWTSHGPPDVPTSIAVDPNSPWTVYAATDGRLFKSVDGGVRWNALPPPSGEIGYGGIVAAAATRPTTVYYAVVANELNVETMGIYRSRDAGRTWSGPFLEGLNARTHTLAVAPSDPLTVYAGNYAYGGPFRSEDGGATWTRAGNFWTSLSIAVDPRNPEAVYTAASPEEGPSGVWKTTDGGETWTLLLETNAWVVALDGAHPDVVYAGGEGLYRSANGGATWTPLAATEDWAVRGIAIDPRRPSRLFASAYGKGIFASEDGGTTWSGLSTGLPHRGVGQLVIDRLGRTLHVITRYYGVEERATGVFSYTILQATRGRDRLVGTPGPDMIYARAGDDRVRALAGDDRIAGGRGDDRLGPGDGRDRVRGGPGSDVIHVRDGRRDVVVCGRGFDRVGADTVDVVAADCERVRARSPQAPPPIFLVSEAGFQRAAQGSFCLTITNDDGTGIGLCADTVDPEPRRLSIVRPGERVTIRLRGATFAAGRVSVHPRGCEDRVRWRFRLTGPTTRWTVPRISRPEKRFELDVSAVFRTADGRSGDTWGTLGLLVSKTRARDVIPAGDSLACGQLVP